MWASLTAGAACDPPSVRRSALVLVGGRYTYLLKGREDLHLDERIMQFLRMVNTFLGRDSRSLSRGLQAIHPQ
jgi:phosphatidylinositol kinase/protein kinase (PI-3  family)